MVAMRRLNSARAGWAAMSFSSSAISGADNSPAIQATMRASSAASGGGEEEGGGGVDGES